MLEVKNITKYFVRERGFLKREAGRIFALSNVSFSIKESDTFGIVGESGSGKTTLAKVILKLIPPSSGKVVFNDNLIKRFRKDVDRIFQNPYNSLNPRMKIKQIILEPLLIHKLSSRKDGIDKVRGLLKLVGLSDDALERYPIEFSAGQRQRICIARALAVEPRFVVLDEPISSLDLTVQSEMLDLFVALKEKFRLTYIFITHNLAVVKHIANRVAVMQDGRIIESGHVFEIFSKPKAPYTKLLLESARI